MPSPLETTSTLFALMCLAGCPTPPDDSIDNPPLAETTDPSVSTSGPDADAETNGGFTTRAESSESSGGTGDFSKLEALDAFWEAFENDDYAQLPTVIERLKAARMADPADADVQFIYGHANLWRLAELAREASARGEEPVRVAEAIHGFREAIELRPEDARIPCWMGLLELQTGRLFGDEEMIAAGAANVQSTVDRFPEFGHFCQILANWDAPRDSEAFANAVEAGWASIDVCLDDPIDRSDPDVEPYLDEATTEGPRKVCWNIPSAPHNEEGYWLVIGDLFAKAGDAEIARTMYHNATYRDSYETWRYRADLEGRLAGVDDRVAAFVDEDPSNDPELGLPKAGCVMCHAN